MHPMLHGGALGFLTLPPQDGGMAAAAVTRVRFPPDAPQQRLKQWSLLLYPPYGKVQPRRWKIIRKRMAYETTLPLSGNPEKRGLPTMLV